MRLLQIVGGKAHPEWINLDAVTLVTYTGGGDGPAQLELILFNGVALVTDPSEINEIGRILGITIPAS
jgi:hypothetical protein